MIDTVADNNNNNNLICIAPVCAKKTSVAISLSNGAANGEGALQTIITFDQGFIY